MFGKPEWFTYRTFGWGLRSRSWQGAVYILGAVGLVVASALVPLPESARPWVVGGLAGLVAMDFLHIMGRLKEVHDERERYHQLVIERNCSYAAVACLSAILVAKLVGLVRTNHLDREVIFISGGILAIMGLTKAISTFYLRRTQ